MFHKLFHFCFSERSYEPHNSVIFGDEIMKTKFIIGLIAVVAISILATSIVFGHNSTAPTNQYPNDPYAPTTGYYGGLGGCYGGYNQPYYPYQPAPTPDPDATEQPQTPLPPQQPYQPPRQDYYPPQSPNQGYYPRSYGRGCMGW